MKKNIRKINKNSIKYFDKYVWNPGMINTNGAFCGICLNYNRDY